MNIENPIQFIDLKAQQNRIKTHIDLAIDSVLAHGQYILGPEVFALEQKLCEYTNAAHVITCANGTDALLLALMALDLSHNDVVFVPAFTFAATAEVVAKLGGVPYFVDIDPKTFNICPHSLKQAIFAAKQASLRIKGMIAVDIFGLPAHYEQLEQIAKTENLWLLSDAAQSFGASINGVKTGAIADITTTSFFPAKPLGCYGDGGCIFIKKANKELQDKLLSLRNHGAGEHRYDHVRVGINSRLDTLQAAVLLEKLKIFDNELSAKAKLATFYNRMLSGLATAQAQPLGYSSAHAIYSFLVADRDQIKHQFDSKGIPAPIYYKTSLHKQPAYSHYPKAELKQTEYVSNNVLSLPMHAYMSQEQLDYISANVASFAAELA